MAQQQRSHVPKFGSWDGDNVPYTAFFENARKEKGSGVKMNPNDPEENPEAFRHGGRVGAGIGGIPPAVRAPEPANSYKPMPEEKHQSEGGIRQQQNGLRSMTSESGSDKSSSDNHLPQQQNHRQTRSSRKKSLSEVNSFVPPSPSPGRGKLRSPSNPSADNDVSSRSASVPKFGAWDEKDPTSGEGFTVIFNKVKEEKHIKATKFPAATPQPSNSTNTQKKSTQSKMCCCLF